MQNSLLEIATGHTIVGDDAGTATFWISDHELLWLRHAVQHDKPLLKVRVGARFKLPDPGHYEAIAINRNTGTKRPLWVFNARCASLMTAKPMSVHCEGESEFSLVYNPPSCALSPDGQYLLWRGENLNGKPGWAVAALDGSRQWVWQEAEADGWGGGQILWKSDSRHWIELAQDYWRERYRLIGADVRSIDDPLAVESYRISNVIEGRALGLTAEQNVLLHYHDREHKPLDRVRMCEAGLHVAVAMTRDYAIALPEPDQVSDLALSPEGTRLAWIMGGPGREPDVYSLWISDVKGRGFRKLGEAPGIVYETAHPITDRRYDCPHNLAWLPNGRHVSFFYLDAVYTIAVA